MDPRALERAEHEQLGDAPDADKLAADLSEASAAFRPVEGGVEAKDAARLRRLLSMWAVVAFGFSAFAGILYGTLGQPRRALGAGVTFVVGSAALVALRLARRGQLERAALVFGYAHFVVMPIACVLI